VRSKPRGGLPARLLAGLFVALALPAGANAPAALPLVTVDRACELIGGRLRSVEVAHCQSLDLKADAASRLGFPLLYRDYLPRPARENPPRVLLIGGIHGDELTSVSITFQWMQRLEQERLQPFHWRIIPSANPDGLLTLPSRRMNLRGVDLNRNFPTQDWQTRATRYWAERTCRDPRRFPGADALSEPESRWLTEQILSFDPQAIISVHAPYGVLDYDGPQSPPQRFGVLRLNQLGTYPGSLGNYAGIDLKLPVITLELPHAGIMPTQTQSQRIWTDMLSWLGENLPPRRVEAAAWHPPLRQLPASADRP
jgi:murein peptide amidase A